MLEIVFWISFALLAYTYIGYPLVICGIASLRARSVRTGAVESPATLIVSAFNEEQVIGDKIRNSLALDYPPERLQIIVVSDASTDATDRIVQDFGLERLRLLRMPNRGGKTVGLNAAVAEATGNIVIFSDANAMYDRSAVRELVCPFVDPAVGCVTGEQRYFTAEIGSAGDSEGLYWRYEQRIKACESRAGSVVGGDGAIYAIRRELYTPMRPEDVSDYVNPLQIVMAGLRNVYQPTAFAMEHSGDSDLKEFRRKTRIVNQAWRATWQRAGVLNPFRHGLFALQLWSHKVFRWLAGVPMLALLGSSTALRDQGVVFAALFWAQVVCYGLAAIATGWRDAGSRPRVVAVPYYFVLVNIASLRGILENLFGKRYATWSTVRENDRVPG